MLDPDQRTLYTDTLRPPVGFRFREAIATTYSLDLETLLTIPLHLALFSGGGDPEELIQDGVALLEALRRTTQHITVFAQQSRILAPSRPHVLYGLLESSVVEVTAHSPSGVFHPKIWLLRYEHPTTGAEKIRLLVLSRNLTRDRSWDLALCLDGEDSGVPVPANGPLVQFIKTLPGLATEPIEAPDALLSLSDRIERVKWELPEPFESVRFHALGLTPGHEWLPEPSKRLGVISPFVSDTAVRKLAATTTEAIMLLSRPEELQELDPESIEAFGRVVTLFEQAEREDGEETLQNRHSLHPSHGLHAKVYAAERGWRTHLYIGSANATNAALVAGRNVEFMAELEGPRSAVGAVEDLLSPGGLGALVEDFVYDPATTGTDPDVMAAEKRLEDVRREISECGLRIRFEEQDGDWVITLVPEVSPDLAGIDTLDAWLVTTSRGRSTDVRGLGQGDPVALWGAVVAHLTTFVAFEATTESGPEPMTFVLALPAEGLPKTARDSAILKDVIRSKDGFLRYVMLLLAEVDIEGDSATSATSIWGHAASRSRDDDIHALFESMTRSFCTDPNQLRSIERLLDEIQGGTRSDDAIVPEEFSSLWKVFQEALSMSKRGNP